MYAIGSKFWQGSKIVRAITEVEVLKRERLRGGGDVGIGSSGILTLLHGTRSSLTVVSDSD